MADDRVQAPSSSAGLMRFYDVTTSSIQIDPRVVMGLCVAVIVLEIALQLLLR